MALSPRSSSLKSLVEGALHGDCKWGHVLQHLDAHSIADHKRDKVQLPFQGSPLPVYSVPSEALTKEFERDGRAVFKVVVQSAPSRVLAAILQLGPQDLPKTVDSKGRVPLHLACKRPWDEDAEAIFAMLLAVHPNALLQRDEGGRTPLHWLLWYHAPRCTPATVALFCRDLAKGNFYALKQQVPSGDNDHKKYPLPEVPRPSQVNKVPRNAAIIPDSMFGCLPLHYAVTGGASLDVLRVLLQAYPLAKHGVDRYGRTPLHWYLGAETTQHVSGEPLDPRAPPRWKVHLDFSVVQALLSSRVARTADLVCGRYPLHWACELLSYNYMLGDTEQSGNCLSLTCIQLLLDHHLKQLTCRDKTGLETPLVLLLSTAEKIQLEQDEPTPFDPPVELLDLLLTLEDSSSDRPALLEDAQGRLPIHVALAVAASPAVVERLIRANPLALVHTMEESLQSPLHAALSRNVTSHLQSVDTINLLLQSYTASKHGTVVDGRIALKMEDAHGSYPIHYACLNKASVPVIRMLVEEYPPAALLRSADGDLPVHCLLNDDLFKAMAAVPSGEALTDDQLEQIQMVREKLSILLPPLLTEPAKLKVFGKRHGMLPLHLAVLFQALSYPLLCRMLQLFPEGAAQFNQDVEPELSFSVLDMHEMIKSNWEGTLDEWHHVRELLFSFTPMLESHRHREELLERCVRVVIDEVNGVGSYHSQVAREVLDNDPLSAVPVPKPVEPPRKKPVVTTGAITNPRKQMSRKASRKTLAKIMAAKKKSMGVGGVSIYDDNDVTMDDYAASVSGSSVVGSSDDDSYFSDKDEEEITDDGSSISGQAMTELDEEGDAYSASEGTFGEYTARQIDEASTMDFLFAAFAGNGGPSTSSTSEDTLTPIHTESTPSGDSSEDKFESAKKKAHADLEDAGEEKKEDEDDSMPVQMGAATPKVKNGLSGKAPKVHRVAFLSDVALRLWTFFALYSDRNNPNDNYVKQMAAVFDEISFTDVGRLVSVPLPTYAKTYLRGVKGLSGMTFRDIASPKCRELIHKTCYFVGKYDFELDGADRLVHRSNNGNTVVLRANEWQFTTEETTDAVKPGMSEAEIWATGQVPSETGLTFKAHKRPVWIKFTKDSSVYENEISCRYGMGVSLEDDQATLDSVVPLLGHYNASGTKRKADRCFSVDLNDDRFSNLGLFADSDDPALAKSIRLKDYPYALVYPAATHGTLSDYFRQHGVDTPSQIKDICTQVGRALQVMHGKGYIHRGVSMDTVVLHPVNATTKGRNQYRWLLSDLVLSKLCTGQDQTQYLGKINSRGVAEFSTQTLPPEAFVQLSPDDLKVYNKYWRKVETNYGAKVDKTAVQPIMDSNTGELYVVRCYFDPGESSDSDHELPPLPYELAPVNESADLWAFGQLLFTLCAGRPLFPSSVRTGRLLGYEGICNWNQERASSTIYEHISDPVAQDLLLQILAPVEERRSPWYSLTMEEVLKHPYFSSKHESSSAVRKMVEKRKAETAAQARTLLNKVCETSDKTWLEERTVNLNCWDFEMLERIHLSPTQMVHDMGARNTEIAMPCSVVLLPYRLHRNKQGLFTPTTKNDVERAERMGAELLGLSKACYFASVMKQGVSSASGKSSHKWSSAEVLRVLDLNSADFGDVQSEMAGLAAMYVEQFRDDPMSVAVKMVQQRVWRLLSCFNDADTFLYFVDELNGVPVDDDSDNGGGFPVLVSKDRREEIVQRGLLFMHLSCLYARGVAKSVSGLVKLIFEAAHPHIPPSWADAAKGLKHGIDEAVFMNEIAMLQEALSGMFKSKFRMADDHLILREYLAEVDSKRRVAGLKRVVAGGACIWTTDEGTKTIQKSAESLSFKEALRQRRQGDGKPKKQERSKKSSKSISEKYEAAAAKKGASP